MRRLESEAKEVTTILTNILISIVASANVEPEEVVKTVEEWAKEHPLKTRQSEFLKRFPNAKLDINGVIAIRPCDIDSKCRTDNDYLKKCGACARDYWLTEVTDNGNVY